LIERAERDGIAVLRLARPPANALDIDLLAAIEAAFAADEAAPTRAVVLTGSGAIFSAGVDLKRLLAGGADYVRRLLPVLDAALARVAFHPKPVVAAINGHAIAGGCVLACAADHRLLAAGAGRMGVTELLVGLPFPAVALEVMRFAVAPPHLQEMLYLGRTWLPEEARARGLADEVVPAGELQARAEAVARGLAGIPAESFALTKRHARQPLRDRVDADGRAVDREVERIWTRPEIFPVVATYVARSLGARRR
jgi:enoyl-CoA hydratase